MFLKKSITIFLGSALLLQACGPIKTSSATQQTIDNPYHDEVIYHVVQRSFYDSNGDLQGDLKGLRQKLGYLQDLGVTSILLLPLYESLYYHNYFSSNFEKIDPEFGTMQDYLDLVKEIHRRGMKLYLDMETQYVTEDHIWFKDSYKNPHSVYNDYMVYEDSAHTKPESIIFNLTTLPGFDGTNQKVTTVNLNSDKVKEYNYQLYKYFVDPNKDGRFDDGVDGFRLDHMMDNLDFKNKWTHLFNNFWKPLFHRLKAVNPALNFVAEQAEWASFGFDYFKEADVDRVFDFRLAFEIRNLNKKKLELMADSTLNYYTPAGKQQVVFIENHDMPRYASVVKSDPGKLRVGAALNLLVGGVPSIYYGQELGMYGAGALNKWGPTDANDIPQREAFEWYKADSGKGMAIWYKNTGPWWDSTNLKPNDGISLEEEQNDPGSLWSFYRQMIRVRRRHEAIVSGTYQTLPNNNDHVFSFLRYVNNKAVMVVVNLSGGEQVVSIDMNKANVKMNGDVQQLWGKEQMVKEHNGIRITLPAYGVAVWGN